jgi:purine-nucleoside phosphorylase
VSAFFAAVQSELGALPGLALGVGPVKAGLGAALTFSRARPRVIIWLGTCGAYGELAVGTLVSPNLVAWADGAARLGLAYVPLAPTPLKLDPGPLSAACALGSVLTVASIASDPRLVDVLSRGWDVENMELWSVAAAARDLGIPLVARLGVTNRVGPQAHEEWRKNRVSVEELVRSEGLRLAAAIEEGWLPFVPRAG